MTLKNYLIISILVLMLIAGVSAYSYQIPVCNNSTINSSCVPITNVSSITNAPRAIMYYQDGNLYITNDTIMNLNNTVIINNTIMTNYTNLTQITQQITNVTYTTYIINNTNGSSYVFQPNISLDNNYVKNLFNELYMNTNLTRFYNKSEVDNLCASKGELTNVLNSLGNCATKGELVNFDTRLANLNNLNTINWSGFNLTQINEHMNGNTGDFNTTWKVIVIIEGIVIGLLLLFVLKTMMGGGDY